MPKLDYLFFTPCITGKTDGPAKRQVHASKSTFIYKTITFWRLQTCSSRSNIIKNIKSSILHINDISIKIFMWGWGGGGGGRR